MNAKKVAENSMWCVELDHAVEKYAVCYGDGYAARIRHGVVEEVAGLSL